MNKYCYSYGNTFKVKFRNHNCYKCGNKLMIIKHRKFVDQKSEEAKYYDFDAGGDGGIMVGPCEFIHKVFYCQKCSENIEFISQINLEDIDKIINKVLIYFRKKDREIFISKTYETKLGEFIEKYTNLNDVSNLCLTITENNKEAKIYKIPLSRKEFWERPYYFDLTKKQLLDFIK